MPLKHVEVPPGYLKCDMHCHTYHSGLTGHMMAFEPMDSYNSPQALYNLAKKRGMDLVTITDHDSIDGCLAFMEKNPDAKDFFFGEEVTVQVPEFKKDVHIAVYNITEAQHREITRLKANFDETVAYLKQENIFHALNHLFHCFPATSQGRRFLEKMIESFDLFEGLNGAVDAGHNFITQRLAEVFPGKKMIAGSDSHTLLRLGTCYTACPASNLQEFLQQARAGNTIITGKYGHFHHLFNDAMGVYLGYFRDIVYKREVHVNWPFWKEMRNALGWIVCLPIFFTGSLSALFVRHWIEKYRQKDYERLISENSVAALRRKHMLATQISQKDGRFYFVSYKAADLLPKVHFTSRYYFEGEHLEASEGAHDEVAKFISSVERREGAFQRMLNRRKIKEIVNFYENAAEQPLIAGTILLFTEEILRFQKIGQSPSVGDLTEPSANYLIIDGQHRLAGLYFYSQKHPQEIDSIDVPCMIFDGKAADFAAEMFVIINSTHTRINKSHLVDLLDRVTSASPEKKLAARLVTMLYENSTSPLQYRINRLGGRSKQEKWVLQSELYNEFHKLIDENYDFWEYNFRLQANKAYDFVCDYFKAVASVMESIWGKKNYMFTRAVTLKAVCRVLGDLTKKEDFIEDWQSRGHKAFQDRIRNWADLSREFRSEGFYERFAAKGQVERTRRIRDLLARNLS